MSKQNELCVAVDFGGTKLLVGAVTRTGEILASDTYKTGFVDQQEAARALLRDLDTFMQAKPWGDGAVCAIGMGLVGQIDHARGSWEKMYCLQGDAPIPIASIIQERYAVPCAIDNDVKAALMAERTLGVGKNCCNFAYINIGTGIAAGLVCDGRVLRGHLNDAGEIGRYVVRTGGANAGVGEADNAESYASGGGMIKRFQRLAAQQGDVAHTALAAQPDMSVLTLFSLADQGNALAAQIIDDAAKVLADMVINVAATCAPETVVFGGGVMHDGRMVAKIQDAFSAMPGDMAFNICRTALNPRTIGLVGAAMLGFEALDVVPPPMR